MSEFFARLERIFIYQDAGQERIEYPRLKDWLEQLLNRRKLVVLRPNLFAFHCSSLSSKARNKKIQRLADELARIRVRNPESRSFPESALPVEADYELRNLKKKARSSAVIYDAYEFMCLLAGLIPAKEKGLEYLHLIVTEQMIGSFEAKDRYHLRSSFYGYPCLISTTGLLEAPARPKEFYFKTAAGIPRELALAELGDRVLHRQDPRLAEILKAQILQCLFYQIIGFPHCDNPACMLFNAHWQEELLKSQIVGRLCPEHQKVLRKYLKI